MLITMSEKEIQCLAVLQDIQDQRITQFQAAQLLNISERQIRLYCIDINFNDQLISASIL